MDEKLKWIEEYLKEYKYVDVLNKHFVDTYIEKFNPKYTVQFYGANSCSEIGKVLSYGYKNNRLTRSIVGLQMGSGFPKWIYVYERK